MSENLWFSDVFKGYRNEILGENEFIGRFKLKKVKESLWKCFS